MEDELVEVTIEGLGVMNTDDTPEGIELQFLYDTLDDYHCDKCNESFSFFNNTNKR